MTAYGETIRFKLRWLLGTNKGSEIDTGFESLANDCDSKLLGYSQDTFAKRPAAGIANRIFKATDSGVIYHDTGTEWEQLLRPLDARAVVQSAAFATTPTIISWGLIERPAGSFVIGAGSGDYTLSNPEEGKFILKWKTAKASAGYAVVVTPARNAEGGGAIATPLVSISAGEFTVELFTSAGAKVADKFSFIVMAGS